MNRIQFSLVTTCRNEMRSLKRWKQNVLEQTRQPDEIVVVDAYSDDGTFEFLEDWASNDNRIRLIQEKGAAAHGRNLAIANTKYEIILSTDMGVRLSENWCEELITPFERDDCTDVVAGNSCIDIDTVKTSVAWAEYYIEKGGYLKMGPGQEPGNRSVAYTKKVWDDLSGLPEDLTFYGDDQTFGRQMIEANLKFYYAPFAMTYWGRPTLPKQFFKEMFNYGKGDGEALIKVPRAIKWFRNGCITKFLVPIFSGSINLAKSFSLTTFTKALREKGFMTAFFVPILLFARGYYHSKGYLIGMTNGEINCINCRSRLSRNHKGYPTVSH